jgi:hypothetical protein
MEVFTSSFIEEASETQRAAKIKQNEPSSIVEFCIVLEHYSHQLNSSYI